jgi:hypothetical protein
MVITMRQLILLMVFINEQGDQIWRIFSHRDIIYKGQFLWKLQK